MSVCVCERVHVCVWMCVRESAAARGFKKWSLEGRYQNDEKG